MSRRVLTDYPRRPILDFYLRHTSPFYSVTFDLDATAVRRRTRELGGSTYAGLCWAFHRALVEVEAFRVRLEGDDVVLHDSLRLGLTVPAPRGTFSFCTLEFEKDAARFLERAGPAMARASERLDLSSGFEPDFAYYTALPRVPFGSFTHVPLDPTAGQPEIAFGRIVERAGRGRVPVGVQVNHRYVDGADLGALYEAAAESFARAF